MSSMVRRNTSSWSPPAPDSTAPSTARGLAVNEVPNSIQLTIVSSSPWSSRARISRSWRWIQAGHAAAIRAGVSDARPGGSAFASSVTIGRASLKRTNRAGATAAATPAVMSRTPSTPARGTTVAKPSPFRTAQISTPLGAGVDEVPFERILLEGVAGGRPLQAAVVRGYRVVLQLVTGGGAGGRDDEFDAHGVRPDRVVFEDVAGGDDVEANAGDAASRDDVLFHGGVDASEQENADSVADEGVVLDVVVDRVAPEHDCPSRAVAKQTVLDGVPHTSTLEIDRLGILHELDLLDHDVGRGVHAHGGRESPDDAAGDGYVGSSGDGNPDAGAGTGDGVPDR